MIFDASHCVYFVPQSMFKNFFNFCLPFPFLHNLLQRIDVLPKRRSTLRGQRVRRLRPAPKFFCDRDQTLLVQRAHVRDQIAVAHFQFGFELLKRPTPARGEERHDRQPPLFVDYLVELLEVEHRSFDSKLLDLVRAFSRPGTNGVNQVIQTECDAHGNVWQICRQITDRVFQRWQCESG
jgi:hypothetical protein